MDDIQIEQIYKHLLGSWNHQDATTYASFFTEDSNVIGFDGSQMNGNNDIKSEIGAIFADHQTAKYVSKVREIKFLGSDIVLLRAVAGMIPPGGQEINPEANAIQSLIFVKKNNKWKISLFQNTPAQFHGRPELAEALTQELKEITPNF